MPTKKTKDIAATQTIASNATEPNPYAHLSVCVMAHTSERGKAIASLVPSLPAGVEICIVFNEQGDTDDFELTKDERLPKGGAVRFAEMTWTDFSFAHVRNCSLKLATRPWILWIDADELLATGQFNSLANLVNVPRGVGALMCTVAGLQPAMFDGDDAKRFASAQPRIIRNDAAFEFRGHCHEQVMWSIQEAGYRVEESPIVVVHSGYIIDRAGMIEKMNRNVSLLIKQCNEWDGNDLFFHKLLHRDLQNLISLKESIK